MRPVFAVALVLLLSCLACGKSWLGDPEQFVATLSEDAHDKAGRSLSGHDASYKGKRIRWTLKFEKFEKTEKGPQVLFDLEPLGIRQKFFESKHYVMMSFEPEPSSISAWQQMTPGTVVTFEGTVEKVFFARMSPGGSPGISYDVAMAGIKAVQPVP